jgi:catechol 2,3-dioxygenase-like lactoylglutathione lyase family enzyme
MKFINPLPFVAGMERSKRFYGEALGISILEDHGDFVRFENGFALHEGAPLLAAIFGSAGSPETPYGRCNLVLYFESDSLDEDFARIAQVADIVHPIETQAWGQRVLRFFDPDGHIVEAGEPQ